MVVKYQIDIFAPATNNPWCPGDMTSFLPSTLTYLARLSESLQGLGNGVTVFWQGNDVEFNGVRYRNRSRYDGKSQVLIGWGSPDSFPLKANADCVLYRPDAGEPDYKDYAGVYSQIDLIITRSAWHSELIGPKIAKALEQDENGVPNIDLVNVPPGIDMADFKFDAPVSRENHQCLYAAPWNRGLRIMLQFWGKIRKEFRGARLFVTYGSAASARKSGANEAALENSYGKLLKQPGVIEIGMVTRKEVTRLYLESDILAYPCNDTEVFPLSTFEAQCAGCIPVTTKEGALPEVNVMGVASTATDWFDSMLAMMDNDALKAILRKKMAEKMEFPTWDQVAAGWMELVGKNIKAHK